MSSRDDLHVKTNPKSDVDGNSSKPCVVGVLIDRCPYFYPMGGISTESLLVVLADGRVLRVFTSNPSPSPELVIILTFQIYFVKVLLFHTAPIWALAAGDRIAVTGTSV